MVIAARAFVIKVVVMCYSEFSGEVCCSEDDVNDEKCCRDEKDDIAKFRGGCTTLWCCASGGRW